MSEPIPTSIHVPKRINGLAIRAIAFLLLFLGFLSNVWHVADQKWFENHQRDSESLVMGRLVKSRQDGIFSAAGLTGQGGENDVKEFGPHSDQIQDEYQYHAYLDKLTFNKYLPYFSKNGGEAMLFSLLDRLSPFSPQANLRLFHALTALLSAIALAAIVGWFHAEFGGWVAIVVMGTTLLSPWLTVFGRNLWWGLWAFYLPMVVVMYFLMRHRTLINRQWTVLGILIFISVFTKCFINGYEYMTTTLIMMVTPLVYYSIIDAWKRRQCLRCALATLVGTSVAIGLSLTLLCLQIGSVKGGFRDGVEHVAFSLGKRTHGNVQNFPAEYTASLEAGTMRVFRTYVAGTFLDLNSDLPQSNALVSKYLLKIRYAHLIVLFGAASVLLFFRTTPTHRPRNVALLVATWFSILAPISWFVIFKAHSFIHTRMNFLLWQMPFTFFGFAVLGLAIRRNQVVSK